MREDALAATALVQIIVDETDARRQFPAGDERGITKAMM